jgi:hypothetical protein
MTKISHIKSAEQRVNDSTIELIEEWLIRAKSGEIVGIIAMIEIKDGFVDVEHSSTLSRLQRTGALFEMAMTTVNK